MGIADLTLSTAARLIRSGSHSIRENLPDGWLSSQAPIPMPMWGFDDVLPVWWEAGGYTLLPAVGRGLSLTSETLAGLPWRSYRQRGDQQEQVPVPAWIADPQNAQRDGRIPGVGLSNPMPPVAFWADALAAVVLHGNALIYAPNRDGDSRPLPPLYTLRRGMWRWEPDEGCYKVGSDGLRVWPEETVLIRGKPPYDRFGFGVGLLRTYANALGLGDAVARYAATTFRTGIPYGYLSVSQPATADQLGKLKADWLAAHADERTIAVLGAGVKFDAIQVNPVDADLIKVQDAALRDIAHAMGLSAHDLDVQGSSDTYANVQDRIMSRRQFSLLQWALLLESALEVHLPAGTTLKIALDGLERGTTLQRYQEHELGLRAGFLTVDEVRALEDLPPLPEPPPAPEPPALPPAPEEVP